MSNRAKAGKSSSINPASPASQPSVRQTDSVPGTDAQQLSLRARYRPAGDIDVDLRVAGGVALAAIIALVALSALAVVLCFALR
jgi:hypothetical protein